MDGSISLGIVDIVIILLTLIISIAIGVYYCILSTKYKSTLKGYLLANNKGGVLSVALSVMATYLPATAILGSPSEHYAYGSAFLVVTWCKVFYSFINIYLYLPVFFKMQLISPYQYLEKRFSYSIRCLASLFSTLITIFSNGVILFVPSVALESLIGLSTEWSIIITSLTCSFYSVIGGIRAVIITDVFQAILMYTSLILIIVVATVQDEGGFFSVMENSRKGGRLNIFIMDADPTIRHTFWSTFIGGGLAYLSATISLETHVQRYMIMKTVKDAGRMILTSTLFIALIGLFSLYSGLAIYNTYRDCDPVKSGRISKYDGIVPLFVQDYLSPIPGAVGIFVSGILAASLSTSSSSINSLAAMLTEDFIKPLYRLKYNKDCSEQKAVFYAKLCSVICSILSIVIAFSFRNSPSVLELTMTFQFCIVSPLLGIFTLGIFFPFANKHGALYGFLTGTIIITFVSLGGPKPPLVPLPMSTEKCILNDTINLTTDIFNSTVSTAASHVEYSYIHRLSYLWLPLFGIVPTLVVGLIVSVITGYFSKDNMKEIDYDLLSPPVKYYLMKRRVRIHSNQLSDFPINSRTPTNEKLESPDNGLLQQ